MKIKNVEICNFRAFSDVNKATFDFTKDGETLDFVSIYAPNGFGKTSFYDAVEWCITGQIERFHRNASEYSKIGKENRKGNPENPYFLQHKGTSELGYVNVNAEEKKYTKSLTNTKVYNFKTAPKHVYFKDVLLSQDLIDLFIKEEKAEDRYKRFISSFPNLTEYNNKLENITKIIDFNNNVIKSDLIPKKNNLEGKQLQFDYQGDNKIIEEINKSIEFLIANKELLSLIIPEVATEKDFQILHNRISSELINLEALSNDNEKKLTNLENSYAGVSNDNQRLGVFLYFANKERVEVQEKDLNLFKSYKSQTNKSQDLTKYIDNHKQRIEQNVKIKGWMDNYFQLQSEIDKLQSDINKNNATVSTLNDEIKNIENKQEEYDRSIQSLNSELLANQNKLSNISLNEKRLKELNSELEEIGKTETHIKNKSIEHRDLKRDIDLKTYHSNLKIIDISLLNNYKEYDEQKENILEIEKINTEIEKFNKEKEQIETQLNQQNQFQNELNEFVKIGMGIINKNNSDSCPLCNQQYQSLEALKQKVLSNDLLEENIKDLLSKISVIDKSLTQKIESKENFEKKIIAFFTKIIDNLQKQSSKLNQETSTLIEKISKKESLQNEKNQIVLFFEEQSPLNFEKQINTKVNTLITQIRSAEKNIEITKKDFQETKNKIENLNKSDIKNKGQIGKLQQEPIYIEVKNHFWEILNSEIVTQKLIDDEKIELENSLAKNRHEQNEIKREIKEVESKLHVSNQSIEDISAHIENLNFTISLNKKPVSDFEQFIFSEYNISLQNKNKEEVDLEFDELRKIFNSRAKIIQEKIKHYTIIDKLREPTLSYLTLEKSKRDIFELNKEIEELKKIQTALENEKKCVEEYLETEIDEFFYTDLITAIYRKIDPHPDYCNIQFKCDFTDAQPRLQIFTTDKENRTSVPALYFSTAQINILSLSIFLARALNAKDDKGNPIDCIFIDDPIQSMDSINILSFIDLFRSIIVNFNKQIIVSTHEENFHLLLQKKIPENLFKSKFIKFETFGKLAV